MTRQGSATGGGAGMSGHGDTGSRAPSSRHRCGGCRWPSLPVARSTGAGPGRLDGRRSVWGTAVIPRASLLWGRSTRRHRLERRAADRLGDLKQRIAHFVVVRTHSVYSGDPGHVGTGRFAACRVVMRRTKAAGLHANVLGLSVVQETPEPTASHREPPKGLVSPDPSRMSTIRRKDCPNGPFSAARPLTQTAICGMCSSPGLGRLVGAR